MRSLIGVAAGVVAALVLGCGPGKELPDVTHEVKSPVKPAEATIKSIPKDSPEARKVVERGVKAITQNHLELLEKAKVSRVNTHGRINLPTTTQVAWKDADRDVFAVWPDKMRVVYQFKDISLPKHTFVLHNDFGLMMDGQTTLPTTSYTELGEYIKINMLAEHWFLLGLGFNEPEEVIYDPIAAKTPSGGETSVKVKLKDRPLPYTITFDDQNGLPVRISYETTELTKKLKVAKEIIAKEHKDFSGFMLPTVLETKCSEVDAEHWNIESWDFPSQLPESLFLQPKAGQ